MSEITNAWHQSRRVAFVEWRLQWRNWGTWLVGFFFMAVLISEHPIFWTDGPALSPGLVAANWSDRTAMIGSVVAVLTVPFALDRARRQRVSAVEFSKPFERLAYVLGKLLGAALPLVVITFVGMLIHWAIARILIFPNEQNFLFVDYFKEALLIALPPLVFATAFTFCASVFVRKPIVIVPVSLIYLILTTATQAAADAVFSWLAPLVRPEYFNGPIPTVWLPRVIAHQLLYLSLSLLLVIVAIRGFRRARFLGAVENVPWWRRLHIPALPGMSVGMRMLWGGQVVAGLLFAVGAYLNTISYPDSEVYWRVDYALFGLEFYLSVCGLLFIAGVLAHDRSIGALELVLSKPRNRWLLLAERLWPALLNYTLVSVIVTLALHFTFEALPLAQALAVAVITGVYLGMVGFTVANLTRNALAGYGIGILFWIFEAAFNGSLTAPFYLLVASQQIDITSGEVWWHPNLWLPVKIGSLLLALWLFVFNGWFLDSGSTRRRALIILIVSIPVWFALGWWLVPLTLR
jgi:ABC-type transport system involved in multi-copper enzyme maturation permease subunit